jgi:D-3-phosphoglycerate dehydrogenase
MQETYRILVTSTSFGKAEPLPLQRLKECGCEIIENPYGRPLKEDELISLLAGVDGVIAGVDQFTEKVIKSSNRLKVISRYGVGTDNVDLEATKRLGIVVTNTPDVNTEAVADLTFGLILAVSRMIPQSHQATREGKWERFIGRGVYGKVLGIVGLGRIGKGVAKRAKGFEMEILAYDVKKDEAFAQSMGVSFVSLDDLLMGADYVTLHCDLNPQTKRLIGRRELELMKKTAFLINTARGGIVEEEALYEAIKLGKIAGAGLDTYVEEPPSKENPLLELDNVVTTPHIGSYTHESVLEMGLSAVENLMRVLKSKTDQPY